MTTCHQTLPPCGIGQGVLPLHSPLLPQSLLLSHPLPSDMLKFSRSLRTTQVRTGSNRIAAGTIRRGDGSASLPTPPHAGRHVAVCQNTLRTTVKVCAGQTHTASECRGRNSVCGVRTATRHSLPGTVRHPARRNNRSVQSRIMGECHHTRCGGETVGGRTRHHLSVPPRGSARSTVCKGPAPSALHTPWTDPLR